MEEENQDSEAEHLYLKKYIALKRRCEQVQQMNEKLLNRIHQIKQLIKRYKKERHYLMEKLDSHGDDYREAEVPAMWEDGQVYNLLTPESHQTTLKNLDAAISSLTQNVQPFSNAVASGSTNTVEVKAEPTPASDTPPASEHGT